MEVGKKRTTRAIIIVAILCTLLVWAFVGTYQIIPGAWALKLPNRCELMFIDKTLQPVTTLVLVCPHQDMVRLWPWPVLHPWFEAPVRMPNNEIIG